MTNLDVLLLQEHWLFNCQSHVFEDEIENISSYTLSGMEDKVIHSGRRYGGCAILWKRSLMCKIEPVVCDNRRLCMVIIEISGIKMLLCNVYMPCDSNNVNQENSNTYSDVLLDIATVSASLGIDRILVGGDFNTDISRSASEHTKRLLSFIDEESLLLVDNFKCIDYTYESKSNGCKSYLDHFLVTDNVYTMLIDYFVRHDADNMSDHSIIVMEVGLDIEHSNSQNIDVEKLLWHNATEADIIMYKTNLNYMLNDIKMPLEAIHCTDTDCKLHNTEVQIFHDNIVEACVSASKNIPSNKKTTSKCKRFPGWNAYINEYRQKSMFWHKLWKENGSPRDGVVADIRRKTRHEYHVMIKKAKRNEDVIRAQKMAQGLLENNARKFWDEIRKIRGRSGSLPTTIDGEFGDDNIANTFQSKYRTLYNSVSYDTHEMAALKAELDNLVTCKRYDNIENSRDKCEPHTKNVDLVFSVNVEDITRGIKLMKRGKRDGCSKQSSDHIIQGTEQLNIYLSLLFTSMIVHGTAPNSFKISTLIPIPKNRGKSLNDSNNYRAIALSSVLGKLLDNIILEKNVDVFKTTDMQYGFKKKHSTSQCTAVVNEVIQYYLNNESNVNVVMLDASRAFDRVHYIKLFKFLIKRNMCPLLIRFLLNLYTNQKISVKWGSCISTLCTVSNGVKQGGVLSPLLFIIYIDELLLSLKSTSFGCHVGNIFCGAYGYADDIILLAPTFNSLNKMLNVCETFANEYNVLFNSAKSKLLLFENYHVNIPVINFMGGVLNVVDHDKHLGNIIGYHSQEAQIKKCINEFLGKCNMVISHFNNVPFYIKYDLFKTFCMPLYGAQLFDFSSRHMQLFYVSWRKAIRKLLNIPFITHSVLLHCICDDIPIHEQLYSRFIKGIVDSSNSMTSLCYTLALNARRSSLCNSITTISRYYKVPRNELLNINIRKDLKPDRDDDDIIKCSVIRDLLTMRDVLYTNVEPIYAVTEIEFMLNTLCTE